MGRKSPYPEEFRKDAVALYRAAGGKRTYAAVAADLGITAESLRTWVRKETSPRHCPSDARPAGVRLRNRPGCGRRTPGSSRPRRSGSWYARSYAGQPPISLER